MEKPAVKSGSMTAGAMTQSRHFFKRFIAILTVGASVLSLQLHAAAPARETRTVVASERVPFDTTYVDLPNRYRGYTEKVSNGTDGVRRIEAQVVYEGSRPVKVLAIKSSELSAPKPAVVRRGTKVVRTQTANGAQWKHSFIHPLKQAGWLSADYYDYPGHNGIDIAAPLGTPVYAAAGGVVTIAGWYGEYGKCVVIRHPDGSETVYAHNNALTVYNGQTVTQGQQIANVGTTGNSTGNHLHFELRSNGAFLDPLVYMDQ